MTIGEKIHQLRKKAGISQEELAQQVGVSRQAISKWERDEATPDSEKIILLSSVFSISTDYLLLEKMESQEKRESLYQLPAEASVASKKKRLGWVLLAVGIPMGVISTLAFYMWQTLMNSPEVTPPPDAFLPIANVIGICTVVFPVLSLLLIVFGAYRLIAYRKGSPVATPQPKVD